MRIALVMLVLLSACSAPEPKPEAALAAEGPAQEASPKRLPPASDDATSFAAIDAELLAFLEAPPVGSVPNESVEDARTRKFRGARKVNDAYKAMLDGASRDDISYIHYQRSRLFLAIACQMVTSPAPDGATEGEARAHRAKMVEASHILFPGADEALRNSVEADGATSPKSAQLLLLMGSAPGPFELCDRTREIWSPPEG